jgi:transposase-like protein
MNCGNVRAIATYPTQSGRRRLFQCKVCGEQFSETRGTVFFDLRTVEETVILVLKLLLCKVELTALSFALGVTEGTVLEWLRRAAEKAEEINQHWLARSGRHAGSTGRVVELHRAQARHHSNPGR